jgi:hypothetical protein
VPLPRLPQLNRIGSDKRGMQKAKDKLTLVQSENSDPALSTPSISDFTDGFGYLFERDDRLEGWEFRR